MLLLLNYVLLLLFAFESFFWYVNLLTKTFYTFSFYWNASVDFNDYNMLLILDVSK